MPLILRTNEACTDINKSKASMLLITRYTFLGTEKKTKERKQIFHPVWFLCCKMAWFFYNFVAVIALPFLYVNMP